MKPAGKKFPNLVYVTREVSGGDEYIIAHGEVSELPEDAETVAVYQRIEVKTLKVTRELV